MSNNYYLKKYSINYFKYLKIIYLPLLPIKNKKNIKVLDLGCGDGNFIYFLDQLGFKNIYGIDNDKNCIETARKNLNKKIEITSKDARKYLLRCEKFDLIILKDFIEHFSKEDIEYLLNNIYKKLNTNGKIIIQTVNGQSPLFGIYGFGDFTHQTILNPSSMENLLAKHQFKSFSSYPIKPKIYNFTSIVRVCVFFIYEIVLKLIFLAENGNANYIITQNFVITAKK